MKNVSWIDFTFKLPYQNVSGGKAPYDYIVIVAIKDANNIWAFDGYKINICKMGDLYYFMDYASKVTDIYQTDKACRDLMLGWTIFDEYER